jgi:membrane-bound lytic murein transglycosylase D
LNIWQKQNSGSSALASNKSTQPSTPIPATGSKTYVVQPGDTLWDISKKFEGLTIEKIKTLNNLHNAKIQPGQKLIIGI